MTMLSSRGRRIVLTQPACEQMLQHHTPLARSNAADATPWRLPVKRCQTADATGSCETVPRRPKRQAGQPARYRDGAESQRDDEAAQPPRACAPEGANRQKTLPLTANGLQDTGRTAAHTESCGMAAGMPQLRRGTRQRRPSMKAAAASTPAGVDDRRGDTPPKKRCAESQQPLQLRQGAQRRRLDALPHHQQTPQGSTSTVACSACSPTARSDDMHRPKRARTAPARFDDISFAPPSGTQDNAKTSTPSARTGRGSRRSQRRHRCPASASASSGRRTAPTPAESRRAKPLSSPSPSPRSPVQHIALGVGTPVSPAQGDGLPFDRGKDMPRLRKRKCTAC
jgi:hypothetical protein